MKYDLNYFINKFEKIPSKNWCTDKVWDGEGRYCALGHCGVKKDEEDTYEAWQLFLLAPNISSVNDGQLLKYKQKTPRGRVLAYLRDLNK